MAGSLSREEIREVVRSTLAEIKGLDELPISDDAPLFDPEGASEEDAVLDSLDVFDFSFALEERLDIRIPEDIDVAEFETIDLIVDFVERRARQRQNV